MAAPAVDATRVAVEGRGGAGAGVAAAGHDYERHEAEEPHYHKPIQHVNGDPCAAAQVRRPEGQQRRQLRAVGVDACAWM